MINSNIVILSNRNDAYMCSVNGKASKIRNGSTSPIKYTIFTQYAMYAQHKNENDWYELFNNASRGNFSKGYKFTDGKHLSIKTSSGIQKFDVIFPSEQYFIQYYEGCKEFISRTSGIFSTMDDKTEFVPLPESKKKDKGWSGTIPAARQVVMITAFVNEAASFYHFSEDKRQELLENLIGRIFIGDLTGNEIHCENFNITRIDGLSFYEGNFNIVDKPFKNLQKSKKKTISTIQDESNVEHCIFKCSKNLSQSLKRRYGDFSC